jgi:YD repeat-containing protein
MKVFIFLRLHLLLSILILLTIVNASGQKCYPVTIVDNSQGVTTNVNYDAQHNITSVTVKTSQGQESYSVSYEKNPAGYKKIFSLNKADSAPSPFIMTRNIFTYDKNNRLLAFEGSSAGLHGTEKFIYNAAGQLLHIDQESTFTDASGKVSTDRGRIDYVYLNTTSRNPSEIKTYGIVNNKPEMELIEDDVLTYDNNKNISDEFPFSSGPFRAYAANNIISANITYVTAKTNVKQAYTYTFNSSGYPTSKTYQFSGTSTTDTYSYDCN